MALVVVTVELSTKAVASAVALCTVAPPYTAEALSSLSIGRHWPKAISRLVDDDRPKRGPLVCFARGEGEGEEETARRRESRGAEESTGFHLLEVKHSRALEHCKEWHLKITDHCNGQTRLRMTAAVDELPLLLRYLLLCLLLR